MGSENRTTETGKRLFYIAYCLILTRLLFAGSTISAYFDPRSFFFRYVLRFAAYALILVKLVTQDRFSSRALVRYAIFTCAVVVSVLFNQYFTLFDVTVAVLGAHGVKLKKAVRVYFYTASFLCGLFFLLSLLGVIENFKTYRGDVVRYSFGNIYPTDFAATLFYIELAHAYTKRKRYSVWNFLFWTCAAFFVLRFCDARLDFTLILLFAVCMLLATYAKRIFSFRAVRIGMAASIPVLFVLALLLHICYAPQNGFLEWLNSALSGRLYLGNLAIRNYGFTLFGQQIPMNGGGFTLTPEEIPEEYFFVDCGWLSIALRFGVAAPVFLCVVFTATAWRRLKAGSYALPLILVFLALTSVVDHHVMEPSYDAFLLTFTAFLAVRGRQKAKAAGPLAAQIG